MKWGWITSSINLELVPAVQNDFKKILIPMENYIVL